MKKINVLVLDDEREIREEIHEFLSSRDLDVFDASTPSDAFQLLSDNPIDIAVIDIKLPEMNGINFLKEMKRTHPGIAAIVMSGHGEMEDVISALRLGAVDYFRKPFLMNDLHSVIEKTRKHILFSRSLNGDHFDYILPEIFGVKSETALFAKSQLMRQVVMQMHQVARTDQTTVLITGESGTGKELIAKGIHFLSKRKNNPFHVVNCSTVPDELFESEFFGYNKGAFTGANANKPGWFEVANTGTLFLDEIGDLKLSLQSKLLRIMEDRQICRLGSTKNLPINVRLIAATNQNLEQMAHEGRFRFDLYHRLNIFTIHVPALRERKEAIPSLLSHFLEFYSHKLEKKRPDIDIEVLNALNNYDFPGNVRELKHMVERAIILCEGDRLTFEHFDHLKIKMQKTSAMRPAGSATTHNQTLDAIEKQSIERALQQEGYNKSRAAQALNISRQALDRKILKYAILVAK